MPRFLLPALVGGSVLLALLLSGWRLSQKPDGAALDRVAAALRANWADGDLILVDPWFQVGPRQRLGDLPLREPRTLSAEDLIGFRRVHLITLDGIGRTEQAASVLATAGALADEADWGGDVRWRTYRLHAPRRVRFDLWREVKEAQVRVRYPDGSDHDCSRWDGDRWVCPRNPGWNYVGRRTMDIDAQPRECVWMHPVNGGGLLTVELPALAAAEGTALVGGYGFSFGSAHRAGAPVDVKLLAGETELLAFSHRPQRGWVPFEAPLPASDEPLRIELRTTNNGASHFCLALRQVEPWP